MKRGCLYGRSYRHHTIYAFHSQRVSNVGIESGHSKRNRCERKIKMNDKKKEKGKKNPQLNKFVGTKAKEKRKNWYKSRETWKLGDKKARRKEKNA